MYDWPQETSLAFSRGGCVLIVKGEVATTTGRMWSNFDRLDHVSPSMKHGIVAAPPTADAETRSAANIQHVPDIAAPDQHDATAILFGQSPAVEVRASTFHCWSL